MELLTEHSSRKLINSRLDLKMNKTIQLADLALQLCEKNSEYISRATHYEFASTVVIYTEKPDGLRMEFIDNPIFKKLIVSRWYAESSEYEDIARFESSPFCNGRKEMKNLIKRAFGLLDIYNDEVDLVTNKKLYDTINEIEEFLKNE